MNDIIKYPYSTWNLTPPAMPNYLDRLNSAYPNIKRMPSPPAIEDPTVGIIKGVANWAFEHPKEATAIAMGVAFAGLVYMWLNSNNN